MKPVTSLILPKNMHFIQTTALVDSLLPLVGEIPLPNTHTHELAI